MKRLAFLLSMAFVASAHAQDAGVVDAGPAPDAAAPTITSDTAPAPEDMAHAGVRRAMGQGEPIAEAHTSNDVPRGTVLVHVLRPDGSPIERARVRLGVMAQSGDRTARHANTDAAGIAKFEGLATGQGQAYRTRVVSQGAAYAATPFQLDPDHGHDVTIRVFPATHDIDSLLLLRGQAIIELRPERMHVTMQLTLANVTEQTYVFPRAGLRIALPPGATAFQSQESMTDQRLALDDGALRMRGSVPPGRIGLVFGYDLPYTDEDVVLEMPNPFRAMSFGVAIESAEGLTLEVDGFPPSESRDVEGRKYLITELDRAPTDPPLRKVSIAIAGIPGKGPWARIAVSISALVFLLGMTTWRASTNGEKALASARARRKAALVEEAKVLKAERANGDVGPEHYAKTREQLVTELAAILAAEAASKR